MPKSAKTVATESRAGDRSPASSPPPHPHAKFLTPAAVPKHYAQLKSIAVAYRRWLSNSNCFQGLISAYPRWHKFDMRRRKLRINEKARQHWQGTWFVLTRMASAHSLLVACLIVLSTCYIFTSHPTQHTTLLRITRARRSE